MPWAKEKPLGAYLAVYGQGLEWHVRWLLQRPAAEAPDSTPWTPLVDTESQVVAERIVIQGRRWVHTATRQAYHPVLQEWRMAFRWRQALPGYGSGFTVEARLLHRAPDFQVLTTSALAATGLARGEGS